MNAAGAKAIITAERQKNPKLADFYEFILAQIEELRTRDIVIDNTESIFGCSDKGEKKPLIGIDVKNRIQLGNSLDVKPTGEFHLFVPNITSGNLPPANTDMNGLVVIDSTNTRLCFYSGGARYFVTKTAF